MGRGTIRTTGAIAVAWIEVKYVLSRLYDIIRVIKQIERPLHCRLILFNEKMLQSRLVTERASVYTLKRKQ